MNKFYYSLFDVDVGAIIDSKGFNTAIEALDLVKNVIDSYELDKSFADEREIEENDMWNPEIVKNKFSTIVLSPFFDSVSIWLPGHHRKITITKTEENN